MIIVKCDLPCIIVKKKKIKKDLTISVIYQVIYLPIYVSTNRGGGGGGGGNQKSFLKTYVFYVLFRYWHKQVKGHKVTIDIHTTI